MDKELKDRFEGEWIKSPITKQDHVLVDSHPKKGKCKMCIGSGFFTNENPLNYKKNPDFDITKYEKDMPQIMKDIKFDDGESYWYPTTIQNEEGMVYPEGTKDEWLWAYTPIKKLTKEEVKELSTKETVYESLLDVESTKRHKRFLDACRNMNETSFGDI
jgi:hypothetical protein